MKCKYLKVTKLRFKNKFIKSKANKIKKISNNLNLIIK